MTYESLGEGALDYLPCRYDGSRLLFRGPRRDLTGDYVAFLGTSETYGKFVQTPFPAVVEAATGQTCVNLGGINAGLDLYIHDPITNKVAETARATVIQVMGAQNMSNRFYNVHPRRNDRFVKASSLLEAIYRDADFTEYHFTRHMLKNLHALSAERFEIVRNELKEAWVARMRILLRRFKGPVILLWFADRAPHTPEPEAALAQDPMFIDRNMLDAVSDHVSEIIEVVASDAARAEGTDGMVFAQMEAPAAGEMLGAMAHREAGAALIDPLERLLAK